MLFILGPAEQASFWMKNTKIPLSIGFIDRDAILREEHDMQPFDERTTRSATNDICYALEVNLGWFQKHHIDPGAKLSGIATGTSRRSIRRLPYLQPANTAAS